NQLQCLSGGLSFEVLVVIHSNLSGIVHALHQEIALFQGLHGPPANWQDSEFSLPLHCQEITLSVIIRQRHLNQFWQACPQCVKYLTIGQFPSPDKSLEVLFDY